MHSTNQALFYEEILLPHDLHSSEDLQGRNKISQLHRRLVIHAEKKNKAGKEHSFLGEGMYTVSKRVVREVLL